MRYRSVLFCLAGVLVAACSGAQEGRLPRANMITGGTGSDWYRIGSAIAERTNGHFEGQPVTAVPGAGGISNPARVGRLPGDFAISFVSFLRAAREGVAPYRESYPELRHVATLLQNKLHVMAAPRLGLTSLEEIVTRRLGVRIGTGSPGSAEEFLLRESLATLGASYEDIRAWGGRVDLLGSGERSDLYRDGHIDVIVFHIADPSSTVMELMVSHPATFLNIGAEVSTALATRWGVQALRFEPGRYPNLNEPVSTVGLDFGLFTTADMDEHLVYTMVKSIDENLPYLGTVHVGFRDWDPSRMARSGGVPTHPGAERYFAEKGWASR